jgi:hypothetical protein
LFREINATHFYSYNRHYHVTLLLLPSTQHFLETFSISFFLFFYFTNHHNIKPKLRERENKMVYTISGIRFPVLPSLQNSTLRGADRRTSSSHSFLLNKKNYSSFSRNNQSISFFVLMLFQFSLRSANSSCFLFLQTSFNTCIGGNLFDFVLFFVLLPKW